MNSFEKHSKRMAQLIRQHSPRRLGYGTEDGTCVEECDLPVDPDSEVIARELEGEEQPIQTSTWTSDLDVGETDLDELHAVDSDLQAALDSYELEDEISDLQYAYERNEDKIEQLNEVKDQIQVNWNDGSVDGDDVVQIHVGSESVLRAYRGKKLPLHAAMEAIDAKKAALAGAGIALLVAAIWKIWTLIKARFGKGGGSDKGQKLADEKFENANTIIEKLNYNPNHVINTEDLEALFKDVEHKPTHFLERTSGQKTVLVRDFTDAYINEVIRKSDTAVAIALTNTSTMTRFSKQLDEILGRLESQVSFVDKLVKEGHEAADGNKYEANILAGGKTTLEQIAKDNTAINTIMSALNNDGNIPDVKISHERLPAIIQAFGRVTPIDEKTLKPKLDAIADAVKDMGERKDKGGDKDRAAFFDSVLKVARTTMAYIGAIQNAVNKVGTARLRLSISYEKYAMAVKKAHELKTDGSSNSDSN